MVEVFLKHCIYEKCISLIFDGITNAFKKPELDYEILNVDTIKRHDGLFWDIYTIKYKEKIYTFSLASKNAVIDLLVGIKRISKKDAERRFYNALPNDILCWCRKMRHKRKIKNSR